MTDTCSCYRHSECHVGCACPTLECEYVYQDAEYEEQQYMLSLEPHTHSLNCVPSCRLVEGEIEDDSWRKVVTPDEH